MSVDATKPLDSEMLDTYAGYIRDLATQVNANITAIGLLSAIPLFKDFNLAATGDIDTDGTDIQDVFLEVIRIQSTGGSYDIQSIINGREGMIKIFYVAEDVNTITFLHDSGAGAGQGSLGDLILNGENDLEAAQHDIIAFVNLDGDAGVSEDGTWRELFRSLWYG